MATSLTANHVYRDKSVPGVYSSPDHDPKKSEIRELLTWYESAIQAGMLSDAVWKETKANLIADLAHDADTLGVVHADSTSANNGLYKKNGASGAGSWTQITTFLPGYQFVKATNTDSGDPNAITASTSPRLPAGDGVALVRLNIVEANTSEDVTVSFDGGTALTIKTASNANPPVGGLVADMIVLGTVEGGTFRLVSDMASAAIQAAAESAQAAAESARDAALAAVPNAYPLTLSALKALDTSTITTAIVKDDATNYLYGWQLGNYTAEQSADPAGTRIVKADAVAIDTGAWVRIEAPNAKLVDGREYLWPYLKKVMTRSDCTIILSGDSTTSGVGIIDSNFLPQNILYTNSLDRGIKNQSIINEGHPSENTDDWDTTHVSLDMAQDPDLYIVRWGINDISSGRDADDFEASLRSGLTKVREHANGSIDDCAVVLMVPNTISEPTYGRDEAWVETIRPRIRKAARDFHCVYFDTYEMFRDGQTGTGRWLDDPSSLGGIHPTDMLNAQIYGALADLLWDSAVSARVNGDSNISGGVQTVAASVAPSNFPFGTSRYRTDAGYPFDGFIFTTKHVDGPAMQFGADFQANPNGWVRIANTVGNSWSNWSLLTSVASAGLGASAGYTLGTGNEVPKAIREGNMVFGRGWLTKDTPSTISAGSGLATFPASFRPYGEVLTSVVISDGGGNYETLPAQVSASGDLVVRKASTVTAAVVGLSQIAFDVAPS